MPTTTEAKSIQSKQTDLTRSILLLLASLILIFLGFELDGITEYGHHAAFIIAGGCIGYGIRSLKPALTPPR